VFWIRTYFFGFGSTIFFRIRIRFRILIIFWPDNFLKWCLSLLLYVFWNLNDRKFSSWKTYDFSFSSVWFAIFHTNFYFTTVSGSESESKSELFSDSDPATLTENTLTRTVYANPYSFRMPTKGLTTTGTYEEIEGEYQYTFKRFHSSNYNLAHFCWAGVEQYQPSPQHRSDLPTERLLVHKCMTSKTVRKTYQNKKKPN
jgi:hypothetical protein